MTSTRSRAATGMSTTFLHYDSSIGALYDSSAAPIRPPRLLFKMPRVVPDQKVKFESDELFRRLARESEVRYTGFRDRPMEERRQRFQAGIREGHTEIVHLRSAFILNGVCVRWRGWVDLERLDGIGNLDFDEESAMEEDRVLREEIEKYKARLREFEEKQRAFRVAPPTSAHAPTPEQANIQVR